jgi:hypothetical protein
MSDWSDALAAANKVLGKDGKLPKPRVDPASMYPLVSKAWEPFDKNREALEKNLLDLQNAFSQAKNTFKQYADMVDGANFGLKEDDADDKKRIDTVTDLILKALKSLEDKSDSQIETLSKLDRFIIDLRRLKDLKS